MAKLSLDVDGSGAELTTEHAASSYGIPVLVIAGQAYGLCDPIADTGEGELGWMGWASGEQMVLCRARSLGLEEKPLVQKFLGYRPSTAAEVDAMLAKEERE